jgi:hypothetical protein
MFHCFLHRVFTVFLGERRGMAGEDGVYAKDSPKGKDSCGGWQKGKIQKKKKFLD